MNLDTSKSAQSINTEHAGANKAETATHYRLSKEEQNKLTGHEEKRTAKAEELDVPDHIKRMIEQLEKLKEQLELAKERLTELKQHKDSQSDALQLQIEIQSEMVMVLEQQVITLMQDIGDAMKEAGVSDPGVLLSILV
ncbi:MULTISPECIES: hypothetical protein [unclassified Pseudoalteromonas]|uniref:hypothetical protein n=1 Tax=unclassified Pseudoalteromonas TaxID=194690 RepID=UPI000C069F3A|nr:MULTISPECIES: hypothetical protein [unclassified Pseudoalteromonas]MDP2633568.1 hypothetical protein [Pseudoalteromonas sp. 1_MG-2023]PHN90415.1 hypothetical protein CSC79_06855 [Pseudoalteromonas sp. 3D05]